MHLIKAILLICATSVPRAECQPETAHDVMRAPDSTTFGHCGLQSQGLLASTALSQSLAEGHYLKILCTRSHVDVKTEAVLTGTRHP